MSEADARVAEPSEVERTAGDGEELQLNEALALWLWMLDQQPAAATAALPNQHEAACLG